MKNGTSGALQRLSVALIMLVGAALGCNLGASEATPTPIPASDTPFLIVTDQATADANTTALTSVAVPPASTDVPQAQNIPCTYPANWPVYRVLAGDTLGTIAQRAQTTTDALVSGNCLPNADLISVGQLLRVPNVPSAATPIPAPVGTGMSVGNVAITPAQVVSGRYMIQPGQVTLSATNVHNVNQVAYIYTQTGAVEPQIVAIDNHPTGGVSSAIWTVPSVAIFGTITAYGYDHASDSVRGGTILVFYTPNATPEPITPVATFLTLMPTYLPLTYTPTANGPAPVVGRVSISPAKTVNGAYEIAPGTLTVHVDGLQNVSQVTYVYQPADGSAQQVVAVDNNPSATTSTAYWPFAGGALSGTLTAFGYAPGGNSVQATSIQVFSP